jgi:hypothetical protein
MPIAEIQSRWIAQVLAGNCKLPSEQDMERDIDRQMKYLSQHVRKAERHTVEVTSFINCMYTNNNSTYTIRYGRDSVLIWSQATVIETSGYILSTCIWTSNSSSGTKPSVNKINLEMKL